MHGYVHRLAQAQFDQGPVDASTSVDWVTLVYKLSPAQQSELDRLLADQQNPSSPSFHKWLTPEEFGDRFGLSTGDHSKVVAWLTSEGFTVNESARGRNWVDFSGTAGQIEKSLHTSIHRFRVNGEIHVANAREPAVPEALADVLGGFIGLDDFDLKPLAKPVKPDLTSGSGHLLAPEDFATIYNVTPLYQVGIDGTGQKIAIVGTSEIDPSDLRAFRTRFNLPLKDPVFVPYTGTSPGFNTAGQVEATGDLDWSGAIAPNATLYYIYGPSAFTAITQAVNRNLAPVISICYATCEIDMAPSLYRSIAQQGNAQGITLLAASGDSGAAGCDPWGSVAAPFAAHGQMVDFPAVLPEVTGVGGTQFVEGNGAYWAATNDSNSGSALSYIPEAAYNESATFQSLDASGGGVSILYAKPDWQNGPGVPADNARHVPDIALSGASHDDYYIDYKGSAGAVNGTSASTPPMAGIIALLNQYEVANGYQTQPGLGNINPQLYRLAQSAPSAFHDIVSGDNMVPCVQGSPDCFTGSIGFQAGPGYDMATGLGSVDAYNLVTQWNTATQAVNVAISLGASQVTVNDTVTLAALVTPAAGTGTPTGTVAFSASYLTNGYFPLGSAPLGADGGASLAFPVYSLGYTGAFTVAAVYSGDAAFSSGGATQTLNVGVSSGAAGILVSWPDTVWPSFSAALGLSWQTAVTVREVAGVAATITGISIDGEAQRVGDYFPSPNIAAKGSLTASFLFRNLATPLTRAFEITGTDANGHSWTRDFSVNYLPMMPSSLDFLVSATPLTVAQNTAADPSCQWPVQLNVGDGDGVDSVQETITGLKAGHADLTSQIPAIFGTSRLGPWGSLQGTVCFGGMTAPASDVVEVDVNGHPYKVTVSFAPPPVNPTKISATPALVSLAAADATQTATATLSVDIADQTQSWTASIYPANRTTGWLTASQLSGTGPAQITLTAVGNGFEPGAYPATVVLQSPNAIPQVVNVPVMFVLGGSTSGTSISAVSNYASHQPAASPGMALSVSGSNLANGTGGISFSSTVAPYNLGGVTATVNNVAAPVLAVSPNHLTIQIPYEAGAGPSVLGINNNGQIAGFPMQIAPSAPGIFVDASGNVSPNATVRQGGVGTIFYTGAGEISNLRRTGQAPAASASPSSLGTPSLPVTVAVGGTPAVIQNSGEAPARLGTMRVDYVVPPSTPPGDQQVVVTVGGVSSPPAHITVQAAQ